MTDDKDAEVIKNCRSFQEISSIVCHSDSGIIMLLVPSFILGFPKIFDNDLKVFQFTIFSLYFKIYFYASKDTTLPLFKCQSSIF